MNTNLTTFFMGDLLLLLFNAYLFNTFESGFENVRIKREANFLKGIIYFYMSDLYKINNKISQGAFGTVYDGVNTKTGEKIAIKQLFCNKKVLREVHLHERMNHKNVVKIF